MTLRVFAVTAVLLHGVLAVASAAQSEPLSLQSNPCSDVVLTSDNVIGLFSYAENAQVEAVRLLYKTEHGREQLRFKLLRQDAQTLKADVGALLLGQSDQPVRFEAERLADGSCFRRRR